MFLWSRADCRAAGWDMCVWRDLDGRQDRRDSLMMGKHQGLIPQRNSNSLRSPLLSISLILFYQTMTGFISVQSVWKNVVWRCGLKMIWKCISQRSHWNPLKTLMALWFGWRWVCMLSLWAGVIMLLAKLMGEVNLLNTWNTQTSSKEEMFFIHW